MRRIVVVGLSVALLGLMVAPAVGQTSGEVPAQVTVQEAICIQVDTTPVDFGAQRFSVASDTDVLTSPTSIQDPFAAGHLVESSSSRSVTSCSDFEQIFRFTGTDALSPNIPVWLLDDTFTDTHVCGGDPNSPTLNRYWLSWRRFDNGPSGPAFAIAKSESTGTTLFAGGEGHWLPGIVPACVGSDGAGETLTMSYLLTATLAG